ncbi:MAG: phosphatidate cytidylyltransferase [Lachnospiraceae bacterium]|nr:phosphatidate cytidylyltransferase [Lachnospiraceae bacterium]
MNKSFLTRAISGVLLVAIILLTVIIGADVCFIAIMLASLIGLAEIYKVVGINAKKLSILGYVGTVVLFIMVRFTGYEHLGMFIVLYTLVILAAYVFSFPAYKTEEMMMLIFGVIYVSVMMSFVYSVRASESGIYTVWLIFICAWGCDTCAYLTGVTLGKHKMAPVLSPKKSIEGAVGGVIGAAAIGALYGYIVRNQVVGIKDTMLVFALISAAGALISMVGDLAASAIKRNYGIKDFGKLIPGHGGILDRFDSILFTAPVVYYFLVFLGKNYFG